MSTGDWMKKVRAGDPLRISAKTFNTFIDTAKIVQGMHRRTGGGPIKGQPRNTGIVRVQNNSGAAVVRGGVLGIDGPLIPYVNNPNNFESEAMLSGVTPATADHAGKFFVLLEPLADGKIGRAYVDGFAPARVKLTSTTDAYADVLNGDAGSLQGGSSGSAKIIAATPLAEGEAYPIVKWCIVQLGVSVAGPIFVKPTSFTTPSALGNAKYWGRVQRKKSTATLLATSAATVFNTAYFEDANTTDILIVSMFDAVVGTTGNNHSLTLNAVYLATPGGYTDDEDPVRVFYVQSPGMFTTESVGP